MAPHYNTSSDTKYIHNRKIFRNKITQIFYSIAGVATYSSLRPLVYRECSVVLVCYSDSGVNGLDTWIQEVRQQSWKLLVTDIFDPTLRLNKLLSWQNWLYGVLTEFSFQIVYGRGVQIFSGYSKNFVFDDRNWRWGDGGSW